MKEIAIIYDFDGTLAKGNIPELGLLQKLGINKDDFLPALTPPSRQFFHNMTNPAPLSGLCCQDNFIINAKFWLLL